MESAYADHRLLRDLGARGARVAPDIGVEVVVGAETAGVPLAASISLTAECRSRSSASRGIAVTRSTSHRFEGQM
jgi:orotate phosphoribosyltransferase